MPLKIEGTATNFFNGVRAIFFIYARLKVFPLIFHSNFLTLIPKTQSATLKLFPQNNSFIFLPYPVFDSLVYIQLFLENFSQNIILESISVIAFKKIVTQKVVQWHVLL